MYRDAILPLFIRTIKRLLVLAVGIAVVFVAVTEFFPFFDKRIPLIFALLATYLLTAYLFVPFLFRVYRLFIRPKHIPLYCVTPDGFASDPINIGIIGTRAQIIESMEIAGWVLPDARTPGALWRTLKSTFLRQPYPKTPFSHLYLLPIEGSSSANRHHVRFWACNLDGPEAFHEHVHFWERFHRPGPVKTSRQLWVGAASKDIGLVPIRHNAQITHMVDPDTDSERDFIVEQLRQAHQVEKTITERASAPYRVKNRTIGGFLQSDGRIRICILKD
jgi:hypothetical protein